VSSSLFALDTLVLHNGKEVEVLVVKETASQVEFKDAKTGARQKRDIDLIDRILYEDASKDFLAGFNFLDAKNYGQAFKKFATAKKTVKKSKENWHVATIDYYVAYSLYRFSKTNPKVLKKSSAMLKGVFDKHKESRFALQALYYLGESLLEQKNYPAALKVFATVEKNKQRPRWAGRALAAKGRVLIDQEKFDEAANVYLSAINKKILNPEVINGLAMILIDIKKDYKQAMRVAKPLQCSGDETTKKAVFELLGCAAFGLGQYDLALESLLRSTILYVEDELSSRSNLFLAATLKTLMKKNPKDYPEMQFQTKLQACFRKMTVADQKKYKLFKL
jgi:TolA-binding protein